MRKNKKLKVLSIGLALSLGLNSFAMMSNAMEDVSAVCKAMVEAQNEEKRKRIRPIDGKKEDGTDITKADVKKARKKWFLEKEYKAFTENDLESLNEINAVKQNEVLRYVPWVAGLFIASKCTGLTEFARQTMVRLWSPVDRFIYKMTHRGINIDNYGEILKRIETRLRKEVIGQEKAIDRILEVMTGYFESMIEAKENGEKFEGGLILYFTGEPATGKSTVMKIIQEEMGLNSCVCRMSDAIEDKGNGATSVASRLIKPIKNDDGKVKTERDTEFMKQVKNRKPTLYCLDEVDKMRIFDNKLQKIEAKDENGYTLGGSVDEMLRNFGDTGQINGIDASGSILIATSNETEEQIKKLEPSLYNRYNRYLIKFKDLNSDDYKEIISRNMGRIENYYSKKYNVNIKWDETSLMEVAKSFEEHHLGGRAVDSLLKDIRSALINHINSGNKKSNEFKIKYNKENDKIFIES